MRLVLYSDILAEPSVTSTFETAEAAIAMEIFCGCILTVGFGVGLQPTRAGLALTNYCQFADGQHGRTLLAIPAMCTAGLTTTTAKVK